MIKVKALLIATLVLTSAQVLAEEMPRPFEGKFEFYRNDKLIGESTISLTIEGDQWSMRSDTTGTKGVARFLRFREWSLSEGDWIEAAPRPLAFEQEVKVAVKTIITSALFDWEGGTVLSIHKDGETTLEVVPGLLDPVSVGLRIRAGLNRGEQEWRLPMVDDEKIEEQHFRVAETVQLDTALGCLDTHRVDKIRGPQSTRYTQTWYADELAFVPVHIAHGKKDGDHLESRLVALTLDGKPVAADVDGAPCP